MRTTKKSYDRFFNHGGAEAVRTMTNFSPREFSTLCSTMVEHITKHWNVGRGKRSKFATKDVLFMMLLVLKNGGMWDMAARVFNVPAPTFIQTFTQSLRVATPNLYDEQVAARAHKTNMQFLFTYGRTFRNFPCAMCATDVTFQQCNLPVGNIGEKNPFYSGKQHLHGLKVEVSVNPRGFAINCTDFAKGSVEDIEIFRPNLDFHQKMRVKTEYDLKIEDRGPMKAQFSHEWALLGDKRYQGLAKQLRAIHPTRASPECRLSVDEERENDRILSDRVIVKSYFGRLSTLWRICSDRYRWGHDLYDEIFQACVSLTNFHIATNPLRDTDSEDFNRAQNRLIGIGTETERRRRFTQDSYRRRQRRPSQINFEGLPGQI
uniref:Uncharacterized protein AlNc14C368G11068 n=1 Tax=Albugo laibachii Nc14 TaxID=890382 RepID=F0WY22_9STRA|nr:hypothetical protein ALNC14_125150 [Albugo laibachii Nc14]|eukprot:CCA26371.1 hypothetical protein ALNC14_125150 [Albugo laibachii Nc14]